MDKLLLQRSRREQSVQIGSEQFCDEIATKAVSWPPTATGGEESHISSSGEMKTSLRLMIYRMVVKNALYAGDESHTFSCCMCFRSFSSLYVRLLSTGVLKGFMIFLIATDDPVS